MFLLVSSLLYRVGSEAAETGPRRTPKGPLKWSLGGFPRGLDFRASLGAVSAALGPALWGCTVDR